MCVCLLTVLYQLTISPDLRLPRVSLPGRKDRPAGPGRQHTFVSATQIMQIEKISSTGKGNQMVEVTIGLDKVGARKRIEAANYEIKSEDISSVQAQSLFPVTVSVKACNVNQSN